MEEFKLLESRRDGTARLLDFVRCRTELKLQDVASCGGKEWLLAKSRNSNLDSSGGTSDEQVTASMQCLLHSMVRRRN